MSTKTFLSSLAAVPLSLLTIFAATHDFIPDFSFSGSSLSGWRTMGSANWRAENGEISASSQSPEGGWIMLDKKLQDVELYTEFRCAQKCDAGILLRAEKTSEGGWKGVYVPLSPEDAPSELTLNA